MKNILSLIRVKHYFKNLLVFLPLIFSGRLFEQNSFLICLVIFVCFCFTSSIVYVFNDLKDIENDKQHPLKKHRPLASGKITKGQAVAIMVCLLILVMFIQIMLANFKICSLNAIYMCILVLIAYLILNVLYSLYLKNVPIFDILILSSGFLLRIWASGVVLNIPISNWLFLTVFSGSLFLGLGKRRNEMIKNKHNSRSVLKYYTQEFLDKNMYTFLAITLVFYSLWCVDVNISPLLIYSVIFIVFIFMRYTLDVEKDSYGDPIEVVFNDKILLFTIIIYILYVGGIIYA